MRTGEPDGASPRTPPPLGGKEPRGRNWAAQDAPAVDSEGEEGEGAPPLRFRLGTLGSLTLMEPPARCGMMRATRKREPHQTNGRGRLSVHLGIAEPISFDWHRSATI